MSEPQLRNGAIIVLDGPDAAGKTTLAEAIRQHVGDANYSYEHLTYIKDNYAMWRANYLACFRAACQSRHGKVHVIDRGWISENIYSAVYRGGSAMPYDVRGFDRILQRFGALYVMCVPSPKFAVLNHARMHASREEMYAPDDRIRLVAEKYYALAYGHPAVTNPFDYVEASMHTFSKREDVVSHNISEPHTCHAPDVLVSAAIARRSCIDFKLLRLEALASNNLVGNPDAQLVLVADQINPNKKGVFPLVDFGGSSRAISKILHEIGADETKIAWMNATESGSFDMLKHYVDTGLMKGRMVVALGNNAAKRLAALKQPYFKAIHPSFAARFNQADLLKAQLTEMYSRL